MPACATVQTLTKMERGPPVWRWGNPGFPAAVVVEDPVPLQKILVLVGKHPAVVVDFGYPNNSHQFLKMDSKVNVCKCCIFLVVIFDSRRNPGFAMVYHFADAAKQLTLLGVQSKIPRPP